MLIWKFLFINDLVAGLAISNEYHFGELMNQLRGMKMQRHIERDFPLSRNGVPRSMGYYYVDLTKEYQKPNQNHIVKTIRRGKKQ